MRVYRVHRISRVTSVELRFKPSVVRSVPNARVLRSGSVIRITDNRPYTRAAMRTVTKMTSARNTWWRFLAAPK
jgi:hypothetical protein